MTVEKILSVGGGLSADKALSVFNIQRYSLHDGPGIRTTVFLSGCPLDCIWCHNPEGKKSRAVLSYTAEACAACGACASVCPAGVHRVLGGAHLIGRERCRGCGRCADVCVRGALELFGRKMSVKEIMNALRRDLDFYSGGGGLTVSGGEPLMQADALVSLLFFAKAEGISTVVETSGYAPPEAVARTAEYTDIFLYDVKHTDPERHKLYTGKDNRKILENLSLLDSLSARVVLRCPVIPEINDTAEHFISVAELAERHTSVEAVELMPYHSLWHAKADRIGEKIRYSRTAPLEAVRAEDCAEILRKNTKKPVNVNKTL